jgi:retinol-binding protein 3
MTAWMSGRWGRPTNDADPLTLRPFPRLAHLRDTQGGFMRSIILLAALLAAPAAFAQTVAPPDTPAGRVLGFWLDALNSDDRALLEKFDAAYDGRAPWTLPSALRLREQSGGFELTGIRESRPHYVEYTAKERGSGRDTIGMLEVSDATPPRVVNSQIRLLMPGARVIGYGIDAPTRERVIAGIIRKLDEFYVFPDTARKMGEALRAHEKSGVYANVGNGVQFASLLTRQLQDVSGDKHLRIEFSPVDSPPGPPMRPPPAGDCGFEKVEVLDGNIGYIKLNGFFPPDACATKASDAIAKVADAKALIVDLRDNGGGAPPMVAHVTSYLFAQRTHLNDLWNRRTGETEEFWTNPDVPGRKLVTQPVYLLTARRTFSGAEEFSYNLQNLKRATIVGETTGGGAHPVRGEKLDSVSRSACRTRARSIRSRRRTGKGRGLCRT